MWGFPSISPKNDVIIVASDFPKSMTLSQISLSRVLYLQFFYFRGYFPSAISFARVNARTEEGTQREVLVTKLYMRDVVFEKTPNTDGSLADRILAKY